MKNIAIVIPTFNELENIEKLIHEIKIKLPDLVIARLDVAPEVTEPIAATYCIQ